MKYPRLLLSAALAALLFTAPASAQTDMEPLIQKLKMEPGETFIGGGSASLNDTIRQHLRRLAKAPERYRFSVREEGGFEDPYAEGVITVKLLDGANADADGAAFEAVAVCTAEMEKPKKDSAKFRALYTGEKFAMTCADNRTGFSLRFHSTLFACFASEQDLQMALGQRTVPQFTFRKDMKPGEYAILRRGLGIHSVIALKLAKSADGRMTFDIVKDWPGKVPQEDVLHSIAENATGTVTVDATTGSIVEATIKETEIQDGKTTLVTETKFELLK